MPKPPDPHPHEDAIRQDEARDHAQAGVRATRIAHLTEVVLNTLVGEGMPGAYLGAARVAIFHVLADDIYGNRAIDTPDLSRGGRWPDLVAAELDKPRLR